MSRSRRTSTDHVAHPEVRAGCWGLADFRVQLVVVALAAVLANVTMLGNPFLFDDRALLVESTWLHDVRNWLTIATSPYWPPPFEPDLYRPLTSVLLAAQYTIGDGAVSLFRVTSLLLLAGMSVGVLALARTVLPRLTAFGVALLFGVHPVHTDAVAAAVGQNELLVGVFSIAAVTLYVRARIHPPPPGVWVWLALLYAGASLAKEQGLLLPLLLAAAEVTVVRGRAASGPIPQRAFGAFLFVMVGAFVLAVRTISLGGHLAPPAAADALQGSGVAGRALTMLGVVPEWLRLLVWPQRLLIEYRAGDFVAATGWGPSEIVGLVLLVGTLSLGWACRRRAPVVSFGVLWVCITLLPVSNVFLPTYVLLAERTLLMPSVGFLLMCGGLVGAGAQRYPALGGRLAPLGLGIVIALALLGGIRSAVRYRDWQSHEMLVEATLRASPRNWNALAARGDIWFDRGQPEPGADAYAQSVVWAPEAWAVRTRFALRLLASGADAAAVEQLELSLAENPDQIDAMAEYLPGLIAVGRYERARALADSIIQVAGAPPAVVWLRTLADSALRTGAPAGSIRVRISGH